MQIIHFYTYPDNDKKLFLLNAKGMIQTRPESLEAVWKTF